MANYTEADRKAMRGTLTAVDREIEAHKAIERDEEGRDDAAERRLSGDDLTVYEKLERLQRLRADIEAELGAV